MEIYGYSKIKDKAAPCGGTKLYGTFDERINALISGLFLRVDMRAVVDFFRYRLNRFAAGEFFGKLMRAACLIYGYTKNAELLRVIDGAAADIMSVSDDDGDISTSPKAEQPNGSSGSDLWERKYVLLGLWEYYMITKRNDVLDCMMKLALYTASQVGEPPKTPVTQTGWAFCGIESSSILEPIMRLYNLTGNKTLFELARHIVNSGACSRQNIFEAILSGVDPKDIGNNGDPTQSIAKAYEMMSCFEGLLEYYRATGEEKYRKCIKIFIDKINLQEITYLGSGGADKPYNLGPGTGEQWNYTFYEQANPDISLGMETCVTVTYMKLMLNYYRLTADASLIDKIEVSAYNALLGAMKPDGTFFDYFPKFNGCRSTKVNFSYDINGIPLSCCTANGPMGMAILPYMTFCEGENRIYVNLYIPSVCPKLKLETDYPSDGKINITVLEAGEYETALRIPGYCKYFSLSHPYRLENGYAVIGNDWKKGDKITLKLCMPLVCRPCPQSVNPDVKDMVLYTYGPLVLAADKSVFEDYGKPVDAVVGERVGYGFINGRLTADGVTFIPYYKAGASWDENTEYKCWLKIKK